MDKKEKAKTRVTRLHEDHELLQTRPPKVEDFTTKDPWRVLRMQGEIVEGFDSLHAIGPAVSIFSSFSSLNEKGVGNKGDYHEEYRVLKPGDRRTLSYFPGDNPGTEALYQQSVEEEHLVLLHICLGDGKLHSTRSYT